MNEAQKLIYNPVYARLLIVLGFVFSAIFILGFLVAEMMESIFYCILTAFMVIAGYNMLRGVYVVYDKDIIICYNFFLKERERHSFKSRSEVSVKNNRFYLNGKKLRINSWFIRKSDWSRMVQFYSSSDDSLLSELKD